MNTEYSIPNYKSFDVHKNLIIILPNNVIISIRYK